MRRTDPGEIDDPWGLGAAEDLRVGARNEPLVDPPVDAPPEPSEKELPAVAVEQPLRVPSVTLPVASPPLVVPPSTVVSLPPVVQPPPVVSLPPVVPPPTVAPRPPDVPPPSAASASPAVPPAVPSPPQPAEAALVPDLGELRPYLETPAAPLLDPPYAGQRDVQHERHEPTVPLTPPQPRRAAAALGGLALVALAGVVYLWVATAGGRAAAGAGTFVLSSQPPGAQVTVDGRPAGVTPVALQLTPGPHEVVALAANGRSERLTAEVPAGQSASRHLLLEPVAAPAAAAAVAGAEAPNAPADPPPATAPPAPSFVRFAAPFDVQIFEGGAFLGLSTGGRLRVRPGAHTFTLVNEALGFRMDDAVVIGPGRSLNRVVEARSATLSVNALPWAEVFIEGRSYGETPLANISLPIGTYRVTLRHPTLGEREEPVTVRLGAPNRVAVDLRK